MLNQILKALPLSAIFVVQKCSHGNMVKACELLAFTYGNLPKSPRSYLPVDDKDFNCLVREFGKRFTTGEGIIDWPAVRVASENCKHF